MLLDFWGLPKNYRARSPPRIFMRARVSSSRRTGQSTGAALTAAQKSRYVLTVEGSERPASCTRSGL